MEETVRDFLCQQVETHKQELIDLASRLIQIPNENPIGDQKAAVRFVKDYLAQAGIDSCIVSKSDEYPCLLAQLGQKDGSSVILNGHIDVVPVGDRAGWEFDPFGGKVENGKILGRGASDMKAGMAVILFVMRLLAQSGVKLGGNIRLHLVSDEETGGENGTQWLCAQGYAEKADACIIGEPTSCNTIEIGQKGKCDLTLKAAGTPAHGSLGNYMGDNAILKLAKVLLHIHDLTQVGGKFADSQATALRNSKIIASGLGKPGVENVIDHLTANVGLISGGNKLNMVPDYCEAKVDMRLPIGIERADIEAAVEEMIRKSGVTGVQAEYEWLSAGNFTSDTCPLVETFRRHAEKTWGIDVLPAYQWASSDAQYYRKKGIPTIQYGPANTAGIHSYNENVDVEDVVNAAKIYMMSLSDLLSIQK